jgi:hypothetical protein
MNTGGLAALIYFGTYNLPNQELRLPKTANPLDWWPLFRD